MKYFLVTVGVAVFFGAFRVLFDGRLGSGGALIGDSFSQGVGMGLAATALGCLGMISTKNRFKGFIIGSVVASVLAIYLAVSGQLIT